MVKGIVIERGVLTDGREYRVWRLQHPKRNGAYCKYVYVGDAKDGRGARHQLPWLTKQKKAGGVVTTFKAPRS
jgi:hypothetical protein